MSDELRTEPTSHRDYVDEGQKRGVASCARGCRIMRVRTGSDPTDALGKMSPGLMGAEVSTGLRESDHTIRMPVEDAMPPGQ